jgi:hypothetical protein
MINPSKTISQFPSVKFFAIAIISFFLALKLSYAAQNLKQQNFKYSPQIESESKFGIKRNILDNKLLIPIYQNQEGDQLLFSDLRGRFDDLGSSEYNVAIGYRKLIADTIILDQKQWIIGVYGSIDRLLSKYHHVFLQTMFGAELLSDDYDFRGNIYLPQNKEVVVESLSYVPQLNNSKLGISYVQEKPLKGADIEFGYKLPLNFVQSKLFAGGYYFKGEGYPSISGPRIRAELSFDRDNIKFLPKVLNLTFGLEYQYDQTRGRQIFGLAKFSYKFGANDGNPRQLKNRMTDFIVRDVDVVTNKHQFFDEAIYDDSSGTLRKIHIINANDDLPIAINNADQDCLIILDGSKGNFVLKSAIDLKQGQRLIGGGQNIIFKTKKFSNNNFVYNLSQAKAEISAISNQNKNYLIKLNNDNVIENINFNIDVKANSQSESKQQITKVIYVLDTENTIIKNVSLVAINNEDIYKSYQKLSAIEINNSKNIKIINDGEQKNNMIAGYGTGILVSAANDVTIDGLYFQQNQVNAININYDDNALKSRNIKINNSEFDDNKNTILVSKDKEIAIKEQDIIVEGLTISDSRISNSGQKAIVIDYAKNVTLDNLYIDGVKSHSAQLAAVAINYSSSVRINKMKIIASTEDGLLYSNGYQDFTINGLSAAGFSKNAIHVKNFYGSIIINDAVTETLNGARGLFINHDGSVLSNQIDKPAIGGVNNNFSACKYIGNSKITGYFKVAFTNSLGNGCDI